MYQVIHVAFGCKQIKSSSFHVLCAVGQADVYKTVTIASVLSCIIESFDNSQAKCYTPLKVGLAGGTEIAAGSWYLLDFSASFSSSHRNTVSS